MAYTYDNIVAEAKKAGVLERFTQEDHSAAQKNPEYGMSLVGLLKDVNNATTETQRLLATETMNNLRKSYGMTGATSGAVGSSFTGAQRLVAPEKTGTLSGSDPTTYQTVLDDIVNQKEFAYDHEQDPVYESYAKTYLREGRRASENALAQAAAMSGGRPSSYAISAAQQAGNYYASQLADMIPTLRQNALTEHQNDVAAKYDILSVLDAKQQTEYQKELEEQNRNRLAIQDALTKYQTLGYATPDVAQILGIPEGTKFGDTSQSEGVLNSGIVPLGGVMGALINGTQKTDAQKADDIISGILGTGVGGQNVPFANAGSNTGSESYAYSITNQHNDQEGWVIVGGKKLSYAELDKHIRTSRVVETVDPITGAITYKPGPKWNQNRAVSILDRKLTIT